MKKYFVTYTSQLSKKVNDSMAQIALFLGYFCYKPALIYLVTNTRTTYLVVCLIMCKALKTI